MSYDVSAHYVAETNAQKSSRSASQAKYWHLIWQKRARLCLLTDYERGIPGMKFIPMPVHLILDFVAAAFLVAAPFLFSFANQGLNVWLPFVVAGVGVIILVLVSQTHAYLKAKTNEKAVA